MLSLAFGRQHAGWTDSPVKALPAEVGSVCSLLTAFTSGCTTEEKDVLQVMFGGVWIVYMIAPVIAYFLSRKKIDERIIIRGLIIFGTASVIGPLLIVDGRMDPFTAVVLDPVVALVLAPLTIVYSAVLYCILKMLQRDFYFIIPYILAGTYFVSLLLTAHTQSPALMIWVWPLALL